MKLRCIGMLNNTDYLKGLLFGVFGMLVLTYCTPAKAEPSIKGTAFEQITCLADNIYWEARNQPVRGMFAVAFVVDNRVSDTRYPNTYCEVIQQGPTRPSWKDITARDCLTRYEGHNSMYDYKCQLRELGGKELQMMKVMDKK